eukprot:m.20354 g.20354  ORF g.20354 m.20354 type:complete len:699 (-) comp6817_c0_seq1:68-2164(-)
MAVSIINLLLATLCVMLPSSVSAENKPNILFMMADQLRFDGLGCTGNKAALTPNLDRIANEGLRMLWSASSTPTCTPARAAILTGQSPWNHGMLGYGTVAKSYPVEMPTVLSKAGYLTASFGKDHFGWDAQTNHGIPHGYNITQLYDGLGSFNPKSKNEWNGEFDDYDEWFSREMPGKDPQATLDGLDGDGWNGWHGRAYVYDEYYHPTAWVGRAAVAFLNSQKNATRPFMAKVSFHRPHSPYDPPKRVMDKFKPEELPPIRVSSEPDSWDKRFRGLKGDPGGCGPTPDAWCGLMPENETNVSRVAYYGSVAFVDEQVGMVYEALVNNSLLSNTYIIWSADHGDGQGDHYHWRKGYPYEFSAHVPMLLRWPEAYDSDYKIQRGTVITDFVTELRDIFHTAIDIAQAYGGINMSHFKPEDGKSMLCLLKDPSGQTCQYPLNPGPWREYIDMEHDTCYNETNHWNALSDGKMKYVFRAFFGDEQLFNLTADPYEMVELSSHSEYSAELAKWRQRMVQQFEREGRGPNWVQNGKLMQRTKPQPLSPNYPKNGGGGSGSHSSNVRAGDTLVIQPSYGGLDCSFPQCFNYDNQTQQVQLLSSVPKSPLCITVQPSGAVAVETCETSSDTQKFEMHGGREKASSFQQVGTQNCISVSSSSNDVKMMPCTSNVDNKFVYGASGRICAGGCLTVLDKGNQTQAVEI